MRKIVVLTPVRNEAWILDSFLRACCVFADHVLIADQGSIDGSVARINGIPGVEVIQNTEMRYNEAERIQLLIGEARKQFGKDLILVALDADEIFINTEQSLREWERIRQLPSGTVLRFSKPDVLDEGGLALADMGCVWKLGYVDDGAEHQPQEIHAQRVPAPTGAPIYDATDIKFIHVNLIRKNAHRAKRRMYCVIENLRDTHPLYRRLLSYSRWVDFSKGVQTKRIPDEWHLGLSDVGLSLHGIQETGPFWQDYEVLQKFNEFGTARFYLDDIWDVDWNEVAQACRDYGWTEVKPYYRQPALLTNIIRDSLVVFLRLVVRVKHLLARAR